MLNPRYYQFYMEVAKDHKVPQNDRKYDELVMREKCTKGI